MNITITGDAGVLPTPENHPRERVDPDGIADVLGPSKAVC